MKKRMRLTSNHPLQEKLEKIFDLMHELGVSFEIMYDRVFVRDGESETVYEISDIEDSGRWPEPINGMPPATEYKLTYEKEVEEEKS